MLLTGGERVLLHLLSHWSEKDPPDAITQRGIADAARLRRSHVPRTVKALEREGHVEERTGRVRGRGRRVKLYYLTEAGMRRARELSTALEGQTMVADGGPTTVAEFARASGQTVLAVAMDLDDAGRYHGAARDERLPPFLDRRDELAALAEWVRGDAPAAVLYGGVGMGKTALARRFLQRSPVPFWWHDLRPGESAAALWAHLAEFLSGHGRQSVAAALAGTSDPWDAAAQDLDGLEAVLVLDGYGDVPEEVVDFVSRLLRTAMTAPPAKVLVLAQEATPSYCRFYGRKAVESGTVLEIHMRGLSPEDSRELLGRPAIAEEAFRRIYLLTRGCPLYLELIREGDAETLRARSRFTAAEVNLLMFSRDVES